MVVKLIFLANISIICLNLQLRPLFCYCYCHDKDEGTFLAQVKHKLAYFSNHEMVNNF